MLTLTTFSERRIRHRNAPLTPTGRLRMVRLVRGGRLTFEAAEEDGELTPLET